MDFIGQRTIDMLCAEQARERASKPFLVYESAAGELAELTYGEFDRQTRSLAAGLHRAGLRSGDRVAIMMRNSIPVVVALYACARARLIAVPINVQFAADEVRHVFELVEPRALLAAPEFAPMTASVCPAGTDLRLACAVGSDGGEQTTPAAAVTARWDELVADPDAPVRVTPRPGDVVQLIMTSGTTARPKAVMRTDCNWLLSGYRFAHQGRMVSGDRSMTALPAFHVNCLDQTLMAAFVSGATVVLLERYSASRLMDQARRHRATIVSLVPMLIRTILAQPPSDQDTRNDLRLVLGGLHITAEELTAFAERFGVEILNGYGLTEACTNVTMWPFAGDRRYPSTGLPAFDRVVELVDDHDRPVATGEIGEILVRGTPGREVMLGYFRDEPATAQALRDGWLHTGDLGRADADGYLYFVDRKKDMIKVAGENVAASEVERVLSEHPAVRDVAVVGIPDELRDEAVMAVVVPEDGARPTLEQIREHCAGRLASFKLPTALRLLNELPRGAIGKVNKGQLRESLLQEPEVGARGG